MANNDKKEKPEVRIEKVDSRIDYVLWKVQQFAIRVAKVLMKETAEEPEEEDTSADTSQGTGLAGTGTPQSSGTKPKQQRKTNTSKNAAKPHQTPEDKLIRVARMGELQEMVEETKEALIVLRKTIDDSEIEAIDALMEFERDELEAKNAAREKKNMVQKAENIRGRRHRDRV